MNLKIEDLTKKFGDRTVIDNFSFEFPEKGICIITGASGIGKTTLLRMIAGLDDDYSGKIYNGGIGKVSYMFQEYRLFPGVSALKNVIAVTNESEVDETRAAELLSNLGFSSEDLKKKPRELSGGMKQRVAFARSVIKESPILILDEPTKELDETSIDAMTKIIEDETRKRLVIIVTHDDVSRIAQNAVNIVL